MISVIIPLAANEPGSSREFVDRLNEPESSREVLLATSVPAFECAGALARQTGARVLSSPAPRGERLSEAAREARGDVLLFLHADTVLPAHWAELVMTAISEGAVGGAFRLGFDGTERSLRWVAFWANLRTGLTRVPYGDQAPFVRRDTYERLGGHAPWPLLEDVEFAKRLKRAGPVVILDSPVTTSARRYRERGVFRNVLSNWGVLLRYHAGTSPEELARLYRRKPRT